MLLGKINISLSFFLLLFVSCANGTKEELDNQPKQVESNTKVSTASVLKDSIIAEQLKKSLNDLSSNGAQKEYYNLFPNSFISFKNIFGYYEKGDSLQLGYLYENSKQFISAYFEQLTLIDQKAISEKVIDIAKEGAWQADGVNIFQYHLMQDVNKNGNTYFNLLGKMDNSEIINFWNFYFDSPHPESCKEDFEVLYNRYAEKDKRVAKLMKEEFEKLLSESDGHGH
jgi:hypothetical protein